MFIQASDTVGCASRCVACNAAHFFYTREKSTILTKSPAAFDEFRKVEFKRGKKSARAGGCGPGAG
jgi:hypothetical protein